MRIVGQGGVREAAMNTAAETTGVDSGAGRPPNTPQPAASTTETSLGIVGQGGVREAAMNTAAETTGVDSGAGRPPNTPQPAASTTETSKWELLVKVE
ncbi:hypothetical protein BC826DRAFT_1023177 [Russula brevipes]|nr:hypothetical protein BC826DRAFT_1023177 [Russula brevipes]